MRAELMRAELSSYQLSFHNLSLHELAKIPSTTMNDQFRSCYIIRNNILLVKLRVLSKPGLGEINFST